MLQEVLHGSLFGPNCIASKVLRAVGQPVDPCKFDTQCRHEDEEGLKLIGL